MLSLDGHKNPPHNKDAVMPSFSPLFNDATYGIPLNTTGPFRGKVNEAIADVTVGAAAGATATVNQARIKGSNAQLDTNAGKVTLETFNTINRATTATDVANLKKQLSRPNSASLTFPRDLSGNGGPAFTRSF